ncbi:hypothetical protein ABK905_16065 [Acerihabitans sp. KWT182]|uniref:Uncharacterized protein n=1 Tax=Acerihabitans sp. KWT182 TaxID=3157919 RepID=A0AAU7Q5J2_9GAMM
MQITYNFPFIPARPLSRPSTEFSFDHISGRDVILMNFKMMGGGDMALAEKITAIALNLGCRIVMVPIITDGKKTRMLAPFSVKMANSGADIASLNNPVIVITPVGYYPVEALRKDIEDLCRSHNIVKQDAILIDEMDLLNTDRLNLEQKTRCLKGMGFQNIIPYKLGFSEGAIGYIPIDLNTIDAIKDRCKYELGIFLDSLNLALDVQSDYYLGYICSKQASLASRKFIFNTLVEKINDCSQSNYIIVVTELESFRTQLVISMKETLGSNEENKEIDNNAARLFSKTSIFLAGEDDHYLSKVTEISGVGNKLVNIIFCNKLPKNIFHDFIYLSRTGMASGDQSLSEFLSLTKKVPYYEVQPWKFHLAESLSKIANDVGGSELRTWFSHRIVGQDQYGDEFSTELASIQKKPDTLSKYERKYREIS